MEVETLFLLFVVHSSEIVGIFAGEMLDAHRKGKEIVLSPRPACPRSRSKFRRAFLRQILTSRFLCRFVFLLLRLLCFSFSGTRFCFAFLVLSADFECILNISFYDSNAVLLFPMSFFIYSNGHFHGSYVCTVVFHHDDAFLPTL